MCLIAEIKLVKYRPSVLASSAFLCAAHELIPEQVSSFLDAIISKYGYEYKVRIKIFKAYNYFRKSYMIVSQ